MSAIAAMALDEERAFDAPRLEAELRAWGTAPGRPFPALRRRALHAPVRPLGADTAACLPERAPC